jgi:undecaprenyl-diphosphatase
MTLASSIYGVIEGITELLPISSTAHLLIASRWLPVATGGARDVFFVGIQMGAVGAILYLSWRALFAWKAWWGKIIVGCLPVGLLGLLLVARDVGIQDSLVTIATALIVGGACMLYVEKHRASTPVVFRQDITYTEACIIGLAQMCALVPGVSRSATTIVAGVWLGISRTTLVTFSFLMALPVIGGATLVTLVDAWPTLTGVFLGELVWGSFVAFVVTLITGRYFLAYVRQHTFVFFGWYRIILGVVLCALLYFGIV